ncbi:MAG: ribose-phosphate pyrophosphokinase [endosymbiont of Seepiophila jonesi]|uniref:tRNA1(Val) (adenine(37)-N6)-methyltransferase n=1 Tax=endosymbiont of Lamellibrachia luymesi TaxID=2200907 RepID=A0A370E0J1_9GAMM|nr:MAG: ribose-phosphate pyrophosphokinase [endosymbiont of Lamellibrachia luymesi]RDH93700.1 MAG: ribose-phosphate pyrophosphokinase [endosymbiont of Seepiophila jonesi]
MSTFRFQQFSVRQEKSAMKVCTDTTLFGAMAPVKGGERVLDIGTGAGLLALMAAQLDASYITGIELTEAAFDDARFNFCNSPWNSRLEAVHCSIQHFSVNTPARYDLIISNPPFFHNHSKTSDPLKRQARHTDLLPFPDLLASVDRLLADSGHFYLLLPSHAVTGFAKMALEHGLHLIEQTDFRGHSHNQAKVSALTFCPQQQPCRSRLLTLYQSDRIYSQESKHYLSPFLLRFSQQN